MSASSSDTPELTPMVRIMARWLPLAVGGLVFLIFLPALGYGFVWDDQYNLVQNFHYRGLSWEHLGWMFRSLLLGPPRSLNP